MPIEIKTATKTQVILQLAQKNQDLLRQTSIQIASSNKHEAFKGFAEDGTVERFVSFNETISSSKAFVTSNNLAISRIDAIDQSITQLQDIAANVAQLIAQRRNSASGDSTNLAIQGRAILNDIAEQLNIRFDGQFLFAGTKTSTTPVVNIQTTNIDSATNTPTDSYYAGNEQKLSVKSSSSQEVDYSLLGNDIGFQELIGAVHLAIQGDIEDDDEILQQASEMANNAVTDITSARALLLAKRSTIEQANDVHISVDLLISENLVDISQTDIVSATTRMSELQATIEATYLAFTRLSQLRLSNFLN